MTAMLGNFPFKICDVEKVEHEIKPHWGTYRPIYGDPVYHDTQGRVKSIRIVGKRIAKSNAQLSQLEAIASSKSTTRLTLSTGESARVIVTSCKIGRQKWVIGGGAVEADFSVSLIQTGGGLDIFGLIMGVVGALV